MARSTQIIDLLPIEGGTGGGVTLTDVQSIVDASTGIAVAGQVVGVGEAIFSADTKRRFENKTGNPITLTGPNAADLLDVFLTPDEDLTQDKDFYDREINANGPVVADESVLVTVADLTVDFPATGCLLYTSPSPRDQRGSRMPSSA